MALGKAPASIGGLYLRVTKLDSTGAPAQGTDVCYGTSSFVSIAFSANMTDSTEITKTGANGIDCVSYKTPATLKDFTVTIELCTPDPNITMLLGGGTAIKDQEEITGWASPRVGEESTPTGVAIEVWSRAITDGKPDSKRPYYHHVFPFCKTAISGDRTIENDAMSWTFEGNSVGNSQFGDGPAAPYWAGPSDSPYAFNQVTSKPDTEGFITPTPNPAL